MVGTIRNRHGYSLLEKLNTFTHDLVTEPLPVVQTHIRGQVEVWQRLSKELSDLLETVLPLVIKICEHLVMHVVVQDLLEGRPDGEATYGQGRPGWIIVLCSGHVENLNTTVGTEHMLFTTQFAKVPMSATW